MQVIINNWTIMKDQKYYIIGNGNIIDIDFIEDSENYYIIYDKDIIYKLHKNGYNPHFYNKEQMVTILNFLIIDSLKKELQNEKNKFNDLASRILELTKTNEILREKLNRIETVIKE